MAPVLLLMMGVAPVLAHGPGTSGSQPTPTPLLGVVSNCVGDCNGDGVVSIDELVLGVSISLGTRPVTDCEAFDPDSTGTVTISELVLAVNAALGDCADPNATPTATRTIAPPTVETPAILSAWLLNPGDERSQHIFTDTRRTTGVLVDIESAQLETISGVQYAVVRTSGIPSYVVTLTEDDIDELNDRPLAQRDFVDGQTTAVAGVPFSFGEDIGYDSSRTNCDTTGGAGFWPPGPECPTDQAIVARFPVAPAPNESGVRCESGLGTDGLWLNGVALFNWFDAQSFENRGVWENLAPKFERFDLDVCAGHAANGAYHHHSYPKCLAEMLGDVGDGHSPVYGYVADGYPIHGPWEDDGVLAVPSWVTRDYDDPSSATGCGVAGARTCLLVDPYDVSLGTEAAASDGPDVGETVTTGSMNEITADAGVYYQDYYHDPDLTAAGGAYLDEHNGHTDEERGYHYHVTVEIDGDSGELSYAFPGTVGPSYYGVLNDNAIAGCGLFPGPRLATSE